MPWLCIKVLNVFQFMAQLVHMAVISSILHGQTKSWSIFLFQSLVSYL